MGLYKHYQQQAILWAGPLAAHLAEDKSRTSGYSLSVKGFEDRVGSHTSLPCKTQARTPSSLPSTAEPQSSTVHMHRGQQSHQLVIAATSSVRPGWSHTNVGKRVPRGRALLQLSGTAAARTASVFRMWGASACLILSQFCDTGQATVIR